MSEPLNVTALHDALEARGYHADEMDLDSLALEYAARLSHDRGADAESESEAIARDRTWASGYAAGFAAASRSYRVALERAAEHIKGDGVPAPTLPALDVERLAAAICSTQELDPFEEDECHRRARAIADAYAEALRDAV